jgi:hypothetical protein
MPERCLTCGEAEWEPSFDGHEWCAYCGRARRAAPERATPHRLTGEHIVRERFGDERTDFGGPAGDYHQMVDE